jgi:hypothetical protein
MQRAATEPHGDDRTKLDRPSFIDWLNKID